jgi:hypothetical protein
MSNPQYDNNRRAAFAFTLVLERGRILGLSLARLTASRQTT